MTSSDRGGASRKATLKKGATIWTSSFVRCMSPVVSVRCGLPSLIMLLLTRAAICMCKEQRRHFVLRLKRSRPLFPRVSSFPRRRRWVEKNPKMIAVARSGPSPGSPCRTTANVHSRTRILYKSAHAGNHIIFVVFKLPILVQGFSIKSAHVGHAYDYFRTATNSEC